MACNYESSFKRKFSNQLNAIRKSGVTGVDMLPQIFDFLKSVQQDAKNSGFDSIEEFVDGWVTYINNHLERNGIAKQSATMLRDIITNPETKIPDVKENPNTTETLDVTVTTKKEFRRDFLERIYDGAEYARNQAVKQAKFNFCGAMLFDRDTGFMTRTEQDLNDNIRKYQQRLFDTVFNYLKTHYTKNNNRNQIKDVDYSIYSADKINMYEDGKYTGAFEKIFNTASTVFNTFNGRRIALEWKQDSEALKAFNAYQMLLHFDEFLLDSFGDDVKISNMNVRFSNENKYKLAATATNMAWSNQADDDIDLSKSINGVSKLIVESTRLYDWKGNIIPEGFVQFGQFINVICKLKDLAWDQKLSRGIVLNAVNPDNSRVYDISGLSKASQDYIKSLGKDVTLASLINRQGFEPVEATTALFELLTDKKVKGLKAVTDKFDNIEKCVLMSLGKELFNNSGNSLRVIQDAVGYTGKNNYLNYILQTVDGTWSVRNCQIRTDMETGITEVVGLASSAVKNTQRMINDSLNNLNHYTTSNTDEKYKATYDSRRGFSLFINLTGGERANEVRIDNRGQLTLDGKEFKLYGEQLILFLDEVLHQNFKENPKHLENYILTSKKPQQTAIQELFKFAVEIVRGQYAARKIEQEWAKRPEKDANASKEDFYLDHAKKYYGDKQAKPKVNFDYGTIDIIPGKMLNVLEALAEATILTNSSSSSTIQKDSEGKALSTSTPSRLQSAYQRQFELIRSNKNSPAHTFMIVSDPDTLIDLQTVREYKSANGDAKIYNQFNTREFLESSILHDFLTPLISAADDFSKYGLLNNNTIAITPSVNSDKNTIGKMIINLNTAIKKMGYPNIMEFIKDGNSDKLIELINNELKEYYNKLYKKITKDLELLSNSEVFKNVIGADFKLKYTPESFKEFQTRLKVYNDNPDNGFFSERTLINTASVETGVKINEPLHMVFGKNGIMVNNSLLAMYHRYNNNTKELDKRKMPSSKEFWKYKASELTSALVKNKTFFNTVDNKKLYNFLTENGFDNWISSAGTLVVAKFGNINISSEMDIEAIEQVYRDSGDWARLIDQKVISENDKLIDNLWLLKDNLQLNPLLEKYNMLDYLYSQEFILSTVGTHINHPNKKGAETYNNFQDYLADEAARFQAQHKRNVSYTASMHPFLLNQFDGIPLEYNIAVMEDINDYVYTTAGKTEAVKPFDGATFVNPFIVLLENNSLNGEHAGIHKKQFVHFYDEELGTGGIIKTAGFGITNSWMRNSPFILRMMKNMTNTTWSRPMDITKKIQGYVNGVEYKGENNEQFIGNFYFSKIENGRIHYYKVNSTKSTGNGTYTQNIVEVNKRGSEIGTAQDVPVVDETGNPVVIDSNYKLWNYIFRGLGSVSLNENGELSAKGKYGEASIANTVEIINQCGYLQNKNVKPTSQKNYYQPAKNSDTHYVVTEGAIKQGTANFNTKDHYYKEGGYNTFKIKMMQAGIQLDKEHHADDSEISMMTQVVSACAALGHTWNEANKMYRALYQLALQGIEPVAKPLADLFKQRTPQAQFNFSKVLTGLLVKQLANGSQSKDGLVYNVAYELIEKYRNGQVITDADYLRNPVPVSDPMMFNKIQSLLSSMLTSASIKLKFKGILSVLVPSHETIKLYGGKMKGDFTNFDKEIADLQAMQPELSVAEIEMGRTYTIKDAEGNVVDKVHVQAPTVGKGVYGDPNLKYVGYYEMRKLYNTGGYTFTEDVTNGRNLGAYYCTFEDNEGNKYNFYDLSSSVLMYENPKNDVLLDFQRKNLQTQLLALSEGRPVTVMVNGISKLVTPQNVKIKPYEVVMPKTMAKQLGLTSSDSLDTLMSDTAVFTKKLVNNLRHQITEDNFTVALKRVNGNHLYILTKEDFEKNHDKRLVEKTSYPPVVDPVSGEVYSVDEDGNKLYKMHSVKDKVYLVDGKEVVVTDNLDFYLENSSYNTLYVAEHVSEKTFQRILDSQVNNKGLRSWKNSIIHDVNEDLDKKSARLRNNMLGNAQYTGGQFFYLPKTGDAIVIEGRILDVINNLGQELYTSFKKSLDIIAARIPAQSMQSFMPMKVVGYEEFDINTAYVSTHQIFLQGSDYDIDAVSLLTFELGNDGKFVGWSPYFNLASEEMLQASTELNYPTGKKVEYKHPTEVFNMSNKDNYIEQLRDYVTTLFGAFQLRQSNDRAFLDFKDPDDPMYHKILIDTINYVSENGLLKVFYPEGDALSQTKMRNFRNDLSKILREQFGWNVDGSEIMQIFDSLASIVNKHNLYVNNSDNVEAFTKNYVVEQMYRIAKNPSNLIQAQTSVDQTTGEPKDLADEFSTAGKALKKATPGNTGNKFQSIEDNHVGKDVIGISAVGLKSFFALTQYVNTVLKQGDPEAVDRLLSNPITFNGNTYYTIANANGRNIENADILAKLNTLNSKDAALMISALLSLATDNAKELCLAKLNANAKMAGMYIYGLTMGIPFRELGQLMMSDIGNTVASLLKGSIITDELKLNTIDQVIDYLESPLKKVMGIYRNKKLWKMKTGLLDSKSVWKQLDFEIASVKGGLKNADLLEGPIKEWKVSYGKKGFLHTFLTEMTDKKVPSSEIVKSLRSIKKGLEQRLNEHIPQNKYLKIQALDALIDAYSAKAKLEAAESTLWEGAFNDFKTLHSGASELKTLGTFLGANQGVKNTYSDFLNFVKNFENAIEDRYTTYLKYGGKAISNFDRSLDFSRFIHDPEYRQDRIKAYEQIKASFNILEVLTTVPQYWGYLQTVYTKHGALYESSARHRTNHRYINSLKGALNMDKKIKALDTLVETKSITNYFNQTGRAFYISAGTDIITLDSTTKSSRTKAPVATKIYLGTQGGDATYKNWVEKEVIPNLLAGFTSNRGGIKNVSIANNGFIKSLRPNTFTKNLHKNSSVSYTTSVDMSPRTDEGRLELNKLIQEFDSLTSSYTVYDEDGTKHSIPIKEIFYQYNLIAYNGKSGSGTLTRIFDNYAVQGGKELRQSIKDFDDSGSHYHLSDQEIIVGTSQVESPFGSYNENIYYKNKKDLVVDLLVRRPKEEGNPDIDSDSGETRFGSYIVNGSMKDIDTNVILHRPTDTDVQKLNAEIAGKNWEVVYDPVTKTFTKLQAEDGTVLQNINQVQELLVNYDPNTGRYILDKEILNSLIEYQTNCL